MGIEIIGLSKSFNSYRVLNNINLSIGDGEFVCVIGPSGCGKTTFLRVIGGFEPYTGEISHNKKKVVSPSSDRFIVFQQFNQLLPWKTVFGNVEFGLKLKGVENRQKSVTDVISMVGLDEYRNNYPHELSGGMKQRVAIARALVMNPSVLLMDEPFGSLDAQTRRKMQNELVNIWQKVQKTIIFVTHNIRESILLANRIVVFSRQGEIKTDMFITLPRPRNVTSSHFGSYWSDILSLMEVRDN